MIHTTKTTRIFFSVYLISLTLFNCPTWVRKGSTAVTSIEEVTISGKSEDARDQIFVISLQNTPGVHSSNLGRLDNFSKGFKESCGFIPNFKTCEGVYNRRRGYGPTLSFLFCLEEAQHMNLNVTVIFEDDARLYDQGVSFCDENSRQRDIWSQLPSDTFLAFLGGHSWEYSGLKEGSGKYRFQELSKSWGAYAYAVPQKTLRLFIDMLKDLVIHGHRVNGVHQHHDFISPETAFYDAAKIHKKKVYAIDPLLIWHEGGFSNTWQKERASISGYEIPTKACPLGAKC